MKSIISINHSIGDRVILIEINRPAQILSILKDSDGLSYRVAYWDNGQRKTDYVFDWEIKGGADEIPSSPER